MVIFFGKFPIYKYYVCAYHSTLLFSDFTSLLWNREAIFCSRQHADTNLICLLLKNYDAPILLVSALEVSMAPNVSKWPVPLM